MSQLVVPKNEATRLAVVESYAIHDALPDDVLNVYVRLAAAICKTPVALVSIVERDEHHLCARYGFDGTRTSRDSSSFCAHAIQQPDDIFIVPDALEDARFAKNTLVAGQPFLRYYAAVPLVTAENVALGTLCVMGPKPRTLDDTAQAALRVLGDAVMTALEERRRRPWQHEATPFLFERNPNPMWIYDLQTLRFLAVNDAATRHYGYSEQEFLAMTLHDIRNASGLPALADRLATIDHGLAHSKGWKHRKRDRTLIDVTITSEEVRFGGRPARLVLATDITRETQAEMALVHLAHHDALTGVFNRAGLDLAFGAALSAASDSGTGGAVLFLDLKGFKAINDRSGHAVGDALLVCVARRLAAAARQQDVIARTGGDEFVMIVPGLHSRSQCERFTTDVLAAIDEPFAIEQQTYRVGITIGVSFFFTDGATTADLIQAADAAMYRAKRSECDVEFSHSQDRLPSRTAV